MLSTKVAPVFNAHCLPLESQIARRDVEARAKQISSAWLNTTEEISGTQQLVNARQGLSLLTGKRRSEKLEEVKIRFQGTPAEQLFSRLFDPES